MNTSTEHGRRIKPIRLWRAVAMGTAAGFVASLLVWAIAALAGVDIRIPDGPGSETLVHLGVNNCMAPVQS